METYLRQTKENLANTGDKTVIIVLGNEACDLDSAVSSLVFAFFLNQTQLFDGVVIPVLNVRRKNLKLHSEVVYFLEETSINLDDLICKDEIDIKQFLEEERLKVALVDHNVLSDEDSYLQPYVVYVVDHHVVEHPEQLQHCLTKIEPVGSCCTLVAEEMLSATPPIIDPQMAMLLYGAILLDTVCLEEKAKRVTEKDISIVTQLEGMLEGITREEVFQALQNAKFDVTGYSAEDLLRKDLKVVSSDSTSIAISSVPRLLEDVTNGSPIETCLEQFCCDNKHQAVILLGSHVGKDKKSIRRQIAIFSREPNLLKSLCDLLLGLKDPSLELEPLSSVGSAVALFEQKNISLTRKFVLPAVRSFLQQPTSAPGDCSVEGHCGSGEPCSSVPGKEELETSDIPDETIDDYQPETLDVPDSPNHASLLEIALSTKGDAPEGDLLNSSCQKQNGIPEGLKVAGDDKDGESVCSARKKIPVHPSVLQSASMLESGDLKSLSSLSIKSDDDDDDDDALSPGDELGIVDYDDIDTPEELENSDMSMGFRSTPSEPIAEVSAAEEFEEERSWRTCIVNNEEKTIDMKVIEPYKKVLSHGGYYGETRNAIIIFSACYLPNRSRKDYDYVMDNLFLYVLSTLDQLVAEDYILVYLHGATERGSMPSFGWLKRCYQMIDRRLRKNLKGLYLVHPTFWLKTIVIMTRPFVSSKFSRKLRFVNSLEELSSLVPISDVCIPEQVKKLEFELMSKR